MTLRRGSRESMLDSINQVRTENSIKMTQAADQEPVRLKVAFIVSKFPCYDEAFILRELYALSKIMDISIFSLRRSKEKIIHDEARELLSRTIYIPYLFSWRIFGAHFQMIAARPFAYFRALFRLIFGNLKSPGSLVKSL